MPHQNRTLATGEIVAHPARGLFMGNRGILHNEKGQLGRALWKHKAWIICELSHKDWHRKVLSPDNYTELFFLDEAVAFAAGHRPCKLCRRAAYLRFACGAGHNGTAPELDSRLHDERAMPRLFRQKRHEADISALPDGAIVFDNGPYLVLERALKPVRPSGYGRSIPRPDSGPVAVLTPPTTMRALANGYRPVLHDTVQT